MSNKSVLGKGLASLIGSAPEVPAEEKLINKIKKEDGPIGPKKEKSESGSIGPVGTNSGPIGPMMVDISQIRANSYQPRRQFGETELEELANSIRENGVIQPLLVVEAEKGVFELIAGERRLRASQRAGLKSVPVIVKRTTDRDRLVLAIIENVQRADLNCVEEAFAYHRLMEEFHLTQEEVARKIGKERSSIANFLRILRLPQSVIMGLQENKITFGHAKVLMGLKESDQIEFFARRIVDQQLSVRDLEELVKLEGKGPRKPTRDPAPRDEKLDQLRRELERMTGLHIKIDGKGPENGKMVIHYHNREQFNKIYDSLSQGRGC